MGDGSCFFLGEPTERPPSAKMATLQSGLWSVPGNEDPRTSEIKSCFILTYWSQPRCMTSGHSERSPHTHC